MRETSNKAAGHGDAPVLDDVARDVEGGHRVGGREAATGREDVDAQCQDEQRVADSRDGGGRRGYGLHHASNRSGTAKRATHMSKPPRG